MNIILDIGNVLVDYRPLVYLKNLFSDDSLAEKMNEIIFQSNEWLLLDQGLLSFDEATRIFCEREPGFQTAIRKAIQNVYDIFTPMHETIDLLPVIKAGGHGLYYLSNITFEVRDYLVEKYGFFNLFDGGVFSCDILVSKPSPVIYRKLIEQYKLIPGECVFFDDMEKNVSAAEKEGIKGVLFTTAECIKPFL